MSAPIERVDFEALKTTKARRKGADTVISSAGWPVPIREEFSLEQIPVGPVHDL